MEHSNKDSRVTENFPLFHFCIDAQPSDTEGLKKRIIFQVTLSNGSMHGGFGSVNASMWSRAGLVSELAWLLGFDFRFESICIL